MPNLRQDNVTGLLCTKLGIVLVMMRIQSATSKSQSQVQLTEHND